MKFLAFVDTHDEKKAFDILKRKIKGKKPDFLICAGDFTIFEHDLKKWMRKLDSLNKKLFLIHGNHENVNVVGHLSKDSAINCDLSLDLFSCCCTDRRSDSSRSSGETLPLSFSISAGSSATISKLLPFTSSFIQQFIYV